MALKFSKAKQIGKTLTLKKLKTIYNKVKKYDNKTTVWVKKKKSKPKLPKKVKIKSLEAKLKRLMYPWIKRRDGNVCISCGKKGLVGMNFHAGHYAKAELCNLIYRYNVHNINSQCGYCNKWLRGNTINYRNAIIIKWGVEIVEDIDAHFKDQTPMNFNEREFLMELIKVYEKK